MLPYSESTAHRGAIDDMRAVLLRFGATAFGTMEDTQTGELIVQFRLREQLVTVKASSRAYAKLWLKEHPWTSRMRMDRAGHEGRATRQAEIAVYSILRDWIKAQVTMVECGVISFEGAFLPQMVTPNGETVLERVEANGLLRLGGSS